MRANVPFRLLIYSTNALKWDVTRIYLVKLFSGSNDKNGDATHSCKFAILKIALLVLFEIFLYYSKNEKKLKIGFFNRINATYDQIYHGYLVNMYKLVFAQREVIHYSKSPNANFLDLVFIKWCVEVINDIKNKFCSISTKQDNFSRFDSFLSKLPISCTILATLSPVSYTHLTLPTISVV